ncbi:hypothetical protein O6H91_09G111800 [Diphasiastrum complanatum]|uniref:Uncharacterized protein n=1 Tax=Diphasiastrum complanatum TaxID=34168 RepID=A0ACC2CT58_DIPCM|nr:hypothetical protein O6H91_Y043800 [Diphasiastrum complanatum]KAJ7545233.1 hypothetical protein O6H91_09G111800 [Diphasiastrum complanatum]
MQELKLAQLYQRLLKTEGQGGPLLGLDVGTKYMGVAVSDRNCRVASPHSLIERKTSSSHQAILNLEKVAKDLSIVGFVIGYPIKLIGYQGKQFVREMHISGKFADLCYIYWDERLTTKAVENAIGFLKVDRRQHKRIVDKLSALCILQGCLDGLAKMSRVVEM